jgi:hypothetical protein
LVFAGAYLESDNFNASVRNLASLFGSWSEIINVTNGENRTLVALKQNGQLLGRESEIVGKQDTSPIAGIFLIDNALNDETKAELAKMSFDEKQAYLSNLDKDVTISPEADRTLRNADVIVYGPGTQFSSLLPSYRTIGLPESISESRAAVKIFVANLEYDNDIQQLTVSDLVDNALKLLGDPSGERKLITHIFCDSACDTRVNGVRAGAIDSSTYKSAMVVRANFENAAKEGVHNGHTVVRHAIDAFEEARQQNKLGDLEIFVDIRNRVPAIPQILEEYSNLPWTDAFDKVQLKLSQIPDKIPKLPPYATIAAENYQGDFTEVDALLNWLSNSKAEYLVTLTGDGEYRLADVFLAEQILKVGVFGAVHGSRIQSRHQFRSALNSAYGENSLLHFVSFCGAFVFTATFGLLFRVILSDPFTGFRVYKRSRFSRRLCEVLSKRANVPPATISRLMIKHGMEIAEIPVTYRTFRGFTRPKYRISRGLRNLFGLFY